MLRLSGRYADYQGKISLRARVAGAARALSRPRTRRLHPQDAGRGYQLRRELGWWTVRPETGAGSRRFVSKPTYATRTIAKNDREAALTWMGKLLGLY